MDVTKPAGRESRISDLVVESRIEAAWDPETEQTTQIRTVVGVSASRRRLKSEETWKRKRILGRGAYGTVWLEECIASSGQPHGASHLRAIKEIRKHPYVSSASEFYRELEAIAKFSHERFAHCFVRSSGWFQNDESLFITMEYLKYGDLQQYLTKPFPEPEARQISLQIIEALYLMHGNGFAHRDLKPSNILIFQKGPAWWVKIADFGISKRGVETSTALRTMEIGTRGFMAPEILGLYCPDDFDEEAFEADEAAHDALAYTPVVDLWGLGEITHRMLTQKPAFNTRGRLWSYVTKGTPFPTSELEAVNTSAQGISFIQEVMAASPKKRLTAATAIGHDWLENHECLDETRSRSSTESARELSPSDETSIHYEPSAQWTEITQEAEPTIQLGEDESVTRASQSSAVGKVEAMVRQNDEPSASAAIIAEDGSDMRGTISSTTTASDSSVSHRQPGGLSGQASVKRSLGSSDAVAANSSRLEIVLGGDQAVHSPQSDAPQGYSNHEEARRSEPYIDAVPLQIDPQEMANSSLIYDQRYGSMEMPNRPLTPISELPERRGSSVGRRRRPTGARTRTYEADRSVSEYSESVSEGYDGRLVGSSQGSQGVLHKNYERFKDLYDQEEYQEHEGSSGTANRIMDFFRRRGKARGGQEWQGRPPPKPVHPVKPGFTGFTTRHNIL
ncbi:kinase-like domain-containing protein [Ilyonectria sp. MPI-CAGE-AT-0026]|nr:kinase-like domain-containing protein [Ilyonectria sp. MPI-CAGE-AT-0026]